jgi:hypothetical protein
MPQQIHLLDAVRPAIIPSTRQPIFTGALTPHEQPGLTCSATSR